MVDFGGVAVHVDHLVVSGAFSPDATELDGLRITGLLDTRGIVVDDPTNPGACQVAASIHVGCQPCDDGTAACLLLEVDQVTAHLLVDDDGAPVPLVERYLPGNPNPPPTATDLCADPACAADPRCE